VVVGHSCREGQGHSSEWPYSATHSLPRPCIAAGGTRIILRSSPDGGVTIDDLLYYLQLFQVGAVAADVDDGSGTGTPDDGVTIEDLLYYLGRFANEC
jgi:hypothetical protein